MSAEFATRTGRGNAGDEVVCARHDLALAVQLTSYSRRNAPERKRTDRL